MKNTKINAINTKCGGEKDIKGMTREEMIKSQIMKIIIGKP